MVTSLTIFWACVEDRIIGAGVILEHVCGVRFIRGSMLFEEGHVMVVVGMQFC